MTRDKGRSEEHEDGTQGENDRKRAGWGEKRRGRRQDARGSGASHALTALSHAIKFPITFVRSDQNPLSPLALPHAARTGA